MAACGGRYIVFDSYTGSNSELWRTDADGSNPTRLVPGPRMSGRKIVRPDGKWLVYDNNTSAGTKIYRLPVEGGSPTEIASAPGGGGNPRISPDGKFIAIRNQEGTPVPQGKNVVVRQREAARVRRVSFAKRRQFTAMVTGWQSIAGPATRKGATKGSGTAAGRRRTTSGHRFHLRAHLRVLLVARPQGVASRQRKRHPGCVLISNFR